LKHHQHTNRLPLNGVHTTPIDITEIYPNTNTIRMTTTPTTDTTATRNTHHKRKKWW